MKASLRKVCGLITINNLLSVVFTLYISRVIHNLWEMSQVPVADVNLPASFQVRSHMSPQESFDMHFYLSSEARLDTVSALYVGNFTDLKYDEGVCARLDYACMCF